MSGRRRVEMRKNDDLRFFLMNGCRRGNPSIAIRGGGYGGDRDGGYRGGRGRGGYGGGRGASIGAQRGNPSIRPYHAKLRGNLHVARSYELDRNKSYNQRIHQGQPKKLQEPFETILKTIELSSGSSSGGPTQGGPTPGRPTPDGPTPGGPNQGRLQRWTEHSTLIFKNLKPVEV